MMPEGESSFGSASFGSPLSVPPSGDTGSRSCACCVSAGRVRLGANAADDPAISAITSRTEIRGFTQPDREGRSGAGSSSFSAGGAYQFSFSFSELLYQD